MDPDKWSVIERDIRTALERAYPKSGPKSTNKEFVFNAAIDLFGPLPYAPGQKSSD